jgi:hypothetical protein
MKKIKLKSPNSGRTYEGFEENGKLLVEIIHDPWRPEMEGRLIECPKEFLNHCEELPCE